MLGIGETHLKRWSGKDEVNVKYGKEELCGCDWIRKIKVMRGKFGTSCVSKSMEGKAIFGKV